MLSDLTSLLKIHQAGTDKILEIAQKIVELGSTQKYATDPMSVILAQQGKDSANPLLVAIGVGLLLLAFSVFTIGSLLLTFLTPSIVLNPKCWYVNAT